IAHHYRLPPPYRLLLVMVAASLMLNLSILDWPHASFERNLLYQLPYALVQGVGLAVVMAHRKKRMLDGALVALYTVSTLHFLAKPVMAIAFGSGPNPQGYL